MSGVWERELEKRRQRENSAAAQTARLAGQAERFINPAPNFSSSVNQTSSPAFSAPSAAPRREQSFVLPTAGLGPGFQPKPSDYAQAGRIASQTANEILFGPERKSWAPSETPASRGERVLRDWGLSEQEFRLAGQRATEGRPGAALGWGALGVAGVIPLAGWAGRGVVKGVGAVANAARVADRATGVGRAVRGENISGQFAQEIASGNVRYTADPDMLATTRPHRRNAIEAIHRQGFDAKPTAVSRSEFEVLSSTGDYIPIFRGISGTSEVPASRFVDEFAEGNFFIGGGTYGAGAYFSRTLSGATPYTSLTGSGGNVIEALVPRASRMADFDGPQRDILRQQWKASPFADLGEFLIVNGYDGLTIGNDVILYNRSAAIVPRG